MGCNTSKENIQQAVEDAKDDVKETAKDIARDLIKEESRNKEEAKNGGIGIFLYRFFSTATLSVLCKLTQSSFFFLPFEFSCCVRVCGFLVHSRSLKMWFFYISRFADFYTRRAS